jgi:Ca2+ transporting ATPase
MSIVMQVKEDKLSFRVYTKGAPDLMIDKCTSYFNKKGESVMYD